MACTDVIEPCDVDVIRSCSWPISVASVGWYPTAEGSRPSVADTSEPAWVKRKMLSMKIRTSRPSSRKYSAIVTPVRPTRWRAPGGSFIWPKTIATRSITPDSFISSHRSLPSRVRSPTPAKTEYPPCSWATLRISSWMMTVLPTPAPPKMPILPPLRNGAIRSMTLMPVSNCSGWTAWSTSAGAGRWMGYLAPAEIGPLASIGSPSTFTRRPSVGGPTGGLIGVAGSDGLLQVELEGVVNFWQVLGRELHVHHRAHDLGDAAGGPASGRCAGLRG